MMESINKNTEIVGVSDALKSLATKKQLSPVNSLTNPPPLTKQGNVEEDQAITDNKITINPSSAPIDGGAQTNGDNGKIVEAAEDPTQSCGWYKYRPKFLQRFMSPKWTLCFLCLAGATQGLY
jgi:hypothetical protein